MARHKADIARAAGALVQAAKRAGFRPHIWVDQEGCTHLIEADGLTPPPSNVPPEEMDPWDAIPRQ